MLTIFDSEAICLAHSNARPSCLCLLYQRQLNKLVSLYFPKVHPKPHGPNHPVLKPQLMKINNKMEENKEPVLFLICIFIVKLVKGKKKGRLNREAYLEFLFFYGTGNSYFFELH